MRKNFMYCLLLLAIGSCTKEDPVAVPASAPSNETSVPLPWRPTGLSPATSTYDPLRQVDYTNPPPPTTPPSCGKVPPCAPGHEPRPVGGGCKKDTVPTPPPVEWE